MIHTLYILAGYSLMPPLLLYLAIRSLGTPGERGRWRERLGYQQLQVPPGGIVVHAASVGEVNAAAALVSALSTRHPEWPITLTSFTTTGSRRIREILAEGMHHVYAPLDLPGAVRRFYRNVRPRLLIVLETEIWPNLYLAAARNDIPIMMANARISDASIGGFRRIRPLVRSALSRVTRIAAQSEADADRMIELGAQPKRVHVVGNLKFDLSLPEDLPDQGAALRKVWGEQRPVLLAGSTHPGDEGPLLDAFANLLRSLPDALLVVAPRHPQRFRPIAQRARSAGLTVRLASMWMPSWTTIS